MLHFRVPLQRNDLQGKARKRKTSSKVCASSGTKIWNSSERKYRCFHHQTRGVRQNGGGREKGKSRIAVQLLRDERRQIVRKYWQGNIFGIFPVRL